MSRVHFVRGRVGGGGCENPLSRFQAREGFVVGKGVKTRPSRISSKGGWVVGRKSEGGVVGGGGCETPPSCISSEGAACVTIRGREGSWWHKYPPSLETRVGVRVVGKLTF